MSELHFEIMYSFLDILVASDIITSIVVFVFHSRQFLRRYLTLVHG